MKEEIIRKQAAYAKLFGGDWTEDQLSDIGWLGLVGIPWLLQHMKDDPK